MHVVDRGADDFLFFYHCQQSGTEWVARVKNLTRKIITRDGGRVALSSYVRTLPEVGSFTLNLHAQSQTAGPRRQTRGCLWCVKDAYPQPDQPVTEKP